MTEEGSSNSDCTLVQKLQNNLDDLQIELNEEKEKTVYLENELKKINAEHEKEFKNLKQNFQQILGQKDDKINSLEEKIKKVSDSFEKKMGDLIKLNNLASVYAKFLGLKNKWVISNCCRNECINRDKPIGSCIEGYGYVNLINDENIKYFVNNSEGEYNQFVQVYAENSFNKPQNCSTYSLYYFEIKLKEVLLISKIFEGISRSCISSMVIGLRNNRTNHHTIYNVIYDTIFHKQHSSYQFKLKTAFNNNDIFGCGLVYPSTNKMDEDFPYIFFTQNGKQIGKAVLLRKDGLSSYYPFIVLQCCSVEANFGSNLETKPFKYDVTKHLVMDEFY